MRAGLRACVFVHVWSIFLKGVLFATECVCMRESDRVCVWVCVGRVLFTINHSGESPSPCRIIEMSSTAAARLCCSLAADAQVVQVLLFVLGAFN